MWLVLASCAERAPNRIHLIPDGFMGDVLIVHSVASGSPPVVEGDFRVFRVGKSGVLHTQEPIDTGRWLGDALQFHYVDAAGRRTRLKSRLGGGLSDTPAHRALKGVFVLAGSTGRATVDGCTLEFMQYTVGTAEYYLDRRVPRDVQTYLQEHRELCPP